ncbi:uncharacterized protein DNG_01548 [Cephalotrichum gorgonifer]|uniref:Pinin/SDK/MemA protein domain-containing protein n=1 Tax=Cephalotrichum gorgonifer TaxID=2041049 RepID=A0AAE8MRT1_9PEZI|nr:uncharacterized protein DNG_01548 [Cephalotrichum gorgonifer]
MAEPLAEDAVRLDSTDSNPLKRKSPPPSSPATDRQSESPKRAKTEQERARTDDAHPDAGDREAPPKRSLEEARARVAQEEKRRSKRLFGGLMGALSQRPPAGSQQQRRMEIEKRQQERLREQRVVEQKAMEEKRARLEETRLREAIKWEERVLHVRHSTLLDQARFLRTKAQPPLYYKPWILTADQKDEIRRQVYAAEDTIERELDDFRVRKEEHARRYGLLVHPDEGEREEAAEPRDAERLPEARKESDTQGPVPEERSESRSTPDRDHHDESGDVVVEAGEDVVIY